MARVTHKKNTLIKREMIRMNHFPLFGMYENVQTLLFLGKWCSGRKDWYIFPFPQSKLLITIASTFKNDSFSSLGKTVILLWTKPPGVKIVLKSPADWWKPSCKTLVKDVVAIEKHKNRRDEGLKFFMFIHPCIYCCLNVTALFCFNIACCCIPL